jgi:DNA-directed RNA polymerase specialized sigma24 family protein
MDALTTAVRDALVAEGACPATAEFLATEFVEKARRRVERERKENLAQQLLPLGRQEAAKRIGCHPNHVYRLADRAKEKVFAFSSPDAKQTA